MLIIHDTLAQSRTEPVTDGEVILPKQYVLCCKDEAGNQLEIETNKETYVEVTEFLVKLRTV